ncbi:MAG: hypothetical protein ABWZ25_17050 [Chitinophagaceae bacterium]
MTITSAFLQLSIWIVLLPLVTGFLFFKRLDEPSRIVFYIVVFATVPQLLTVSMIKSKELNIVYNVYTLGEFLFTYFLLGHSFANKWFNYISRSLVVAYSTFAGILISYNGLYHKFLNELVCAASTVYLIWIFLTILDTLYHEEKLINSRLPFFWYLTAILLYSPCTIFVFALTYYIEKSTNPVIHNLWNIQSFFNVVMYTLFAIGFYQSYKSRKAAGQ